MRPLSQKHAQGLAVINRRPRPYQVFRLFAYDRVSTGPTHQEHRRRRPSCTSCPLLFVHMQMLWTGSPRSLNQSEARRPSPGRTPAGPYPHQRPCRSDIVSVADRRPAKRHRHTSRRPRGSLPAAPTSVKVSTGARPRCARSPRPAPAAAAGAASRAGGASPSCRVGLPPTDGPDATVGAGRRRRGPGAARARHDRQAAAALVRSALQRFTTSAKPTALRITPYYREGGQNRPLRLFCDSLRRPSRGVLARVEFLW